MSGENVDVSQTFTYLGSVIHSCGAAILVRKDEDPSFSLAGPPGLAVFLRDLDSDW